ncbi:hypothetical protein a10_09051 [Streptomyces acidiscabies]|nr:hypothetical protein a10_09051 [Streptomyces acidiscabies]
MDEPPAQRKGRTTGGEQRQHQNPGAPGEATQQRRPRIDGEPDRRLRLDEIPDPIRQQPPEIPDPGQLQRPPAERPPVDRDHIVSGPREPPEHRDEQRGHRPRPDEEFGKRDDNSRRTQGPQEEPGQQERPDQPHPEWRDFDGAGRLRPRHPERGQVPRGRHRPTRPERHHGRRHRPERRGGIGLEEMQPERRDPRHPDQRPAHRGDRGQQDVSPRRTPPVRRSSYAPGTRPRTHADPPIRRVCPPRVRLPLSGWVSTPSTAPTKPRGRRLHKPRTTPEQPPTTLGKARLSVRGPLLK